MRDGQPSRTATVVAALRGYARYLPAPLCDCGDPYGVALAGQPYVALDALLSFSPAARSLFFHRPSAWLYNATAAHVLRTIAIDDAVKSFTNSNGTQVLIMGAGMDARALRLHVKAPHMIWFEIDVPASQAAKCGALATIDKGSSRPDVRYVAHNFESDSEAQLRIKLTDAGLDVTKPVLTILEGVVMYLTEAAVDSTFKMLHDMTCKGSQVVISHIPPNGLPSTPWSVNFWLPRWFKYAFGESLVFCGWKPGRSMASWFDSRGWSLVWHKDYGDVARGVGCSHGIVASVAGDFQRVALVTRK